MAGDVAFDGSTSAKSNVSVSDFSVLLALTGGSGGDQPQGGLIQGTDGRLYGTTLSGIVFAVATDGTGFTPLHSFMGASEPANGYTPQAGVIQGADGRLYGTTAYGGTNDGGVIFAVATDGTGFTILHSLSGATDGEYPVGALIQGSDGRLFGTTTIGNVNIPGGTIFSIATDGTGFAVLHSFTDVAGGSSPYGTLLLGADGGLYGTTGAGGADEFGTIFRIKTDGTGFTILHSFTGGVAGSGAFGGLLQGTDGKLYGTTDSGGVNDEGTIYAMGTDGTGFTVLRSFSSLTDGEYSDAALIQGADGMLYGTTEQGGTSGNSFGFGIVFAIATNGTEFTVLHRFLSATDGRFPTGALFQGADGRIYGAANQSGANSSGTLFVLSNIAFGPPSASPRLVNVSTRAQVGTGSNILIPGLVIAGDGMETLLIRADGPSLTQYGVGGVLAGPSLVVSDGEGHEVASNTGWGTNANSVRIASVAGQVGAFPYAPGSADSAVIVNLPSGGYTVKISGVNDTTGVALAEVYEVSSTGTRLTNISTRAQVGTGANILIPGFVIKGAGTEQLLVRGDGPSLTQYGVSGVLAQPSLGVFSGPSVVASNVGWGTSTNPAPAQIASVAAQVGAFPFTSGSGDSAQVVNLSAGAYTLQISGVNSTTGVALAEVYEVP